MSDKARLDSRLLGMHFFSESREGFFLGSLADGEEPALGTIFKCGVFVREEHQCLGADVCFGVPVGCSVSGCSWKVTF